MLRFSSFSLCSVEINYKLYIYLHINYENILWNIFRVKYNRRRWQFMNTAYQIEWNAQLRLSSNNKMINISFFKAIGVLSPFKLLKDKPIYTFS